MESNIQDIKRQLLQLRELHESGVVSPAQYEENRAVLERRLADRLLEGGTDDAATTLPPVVAPEAKPAVPRPSRKLLAGLSAGVVVLAIAGYLWKGTPGALLAGSAAMSAEVAANAPYAAETRQIAAMVDKLVQRLKEQPDDAEGWFMLGRSYSVLGRHGEALPAYEKAVSLRRDDADFLVDYADSMAVNNNGNLTGEPIKLVEKALKINPKNIKALALAGSFAFENKDYLSAAKYWDTMIKTGPADNPMVQQMHPALAEARKLAGLPPAVEEASNAAGKAAAGGPSITGTVTLSAALKAKADPQDTVFIYARAASGSRMPLAIVRKQVKDLPVQFTLDDSLAMSPANKLSGADSVIVAARVSKSGNAMQQPGDLIGQTEPVKVGARDLRVEIKDLVSP